MKQDHPPFPNYHGGRPSFVCAEIGCRPRKRQSDVRTSIDHRRAIRPNSPSPRAARMWHAEQSVSRLRERRPRQDRAPFGDTGVHQSVLDNIADHLTKFAGHHRTLRQRPGHRDHRHRQPRLTSTSTHGRARMMFAHDGLEKTTYSSLRHSSISARTKKRFHYRTKRCFRQAESLHRHCARRRG